LVWFVAISLVWVHFADFDVAVTKELEGRDPDLFGPNGANSKVCALLEMAFNVGMLLGPLISGSLLETLGYFYLNCFMCESVRRKTVGFGTRILTDVE
jgi:predicted MFS family arabinose efflux permease